MSAIRRRSLPPALVESLRPLVAAVSAFITNPRLVEGAERYAELMRAGYECGLTSDETEEVLLAWTKGTPFTVHDQEPYDAIVRRARGEEWRP